MCILERRDKREEMEETSLFRKEVVVKVYFKRIGSFVSF